uniref:Uncharacterized protein n=1 Tax=Rhizophora mucronata TaxID=61149 RepID=A0A2P2PX76_RHIMU
MPKVEMHMISLYWAWIDFWVMQWSLEMMNFILSLAGFISVTLLSYYSY